MQLSEYQEKSKVTALYPNAGNNFIYPSLGLASETGELINKIKKVYRDNASVFTDETRDAVAGEMGDVLWYLAQIANELGLSMDDVAQANLEKLLSRKERGVLSGSGDKR